MENFSTIIQWLNEVDTTLFLAGNGNHTLFMDKVMWFISGKLETNTRMPKPAALLKMMKWAAFARLRLHWALSQA